MSKNNMFNQKLEQIGGENIVDGITLKSEDKEKILNFINANTNQNYILNDNKLEKEKNEQEIKNTLLDEEIDCAIKENRKILIALSENVENVIEMYISEDNTERLILIDKDFCEKDNLEDIALADRLTKALFITHENDGIALLSSTAIKAVIATSSNVYHGPDSSNYAKVGSIDAGEDPVYILATSMGWYHIEYLVTSTGKHKSGYIPASAVSSYSGGTPNEEDFYGGYCYATTELDVRTCDDFNLTAPVGTLFKHEGCTMIFHYDFVDGDRTYHVAFIEYSTSSGVKRGYVYNKYLSFPCETCVAVINEKATVYAGPNSNFASIGSISKGEFISIIAKESDDIYVEYNTTKGRKRGYIKYSQVTPYHRPSAFPDFYTNGTQSHIVDEKVVVYGGPNSNYAQLGSVRNEEVTCYYTNNTDTNNYTFEYTCIEYTVTSTGQRKRGYILASKVLDGNLPEENNPIESFNSFGQFGTKVVYGQTQKGRDMFFYKCGEGANHLFLTFGLHGWEDGVKSDGSDYHGDGNMLLKIAKRFMANFDSLNSEKLNTIKNKWTIYVFPGINLDGIVNGNNNNGFGRCLYNKIDPNRNWGGNFVPNNTNPRYKTDSSYFGATELINLRNCLVNNMTYTGKNVLIDVHGWYNQTVGNSNIGKYYWNSMGIPSSRHSYGYGQGYLIAWAKNSPTLVPTSYDYPGIGAESCLLELAPTTDYSDSNMNNYADKFFNGTINILENYPVISVLPSTPSKKNDALILALEKLTSAAQDYCAVAFLDQTAYNRNRLVLQYLREPAYNGILWNETTESIDSRWIAYAETKTGIHVGELRVYEDIIQKELYVQHLAIVAETAMIRDYSNSEDRPYILLASAIGDLLQLGGNVQSVYNNKKRVLSVSEIKKLVRCTDDSFAQELGYENCQKTAFSWMDWYQDIDGINIGIKCKTDDIVSVIKEYYTGYTNESRLNRYDMYAKNLGLSDPVSTSKTSDLYKLAYSYTSGNVRLEDFFNLDVVTLFKAKFGAFSPEMWADPLAIAFVNEFADRILKVGGNY